MLSDRHADLYREVSRKATGRLDVLDVVVFGHLGMPQLAVYSAKKPAVKGLTEALSLEWQRHGVRVADVLPSSLFDTAIVVADVRPFPRRCDEIDDRDPATAPKKGMFWLMPGLGGGRHGRKSYHRAAAVALVCA